MTATTQTNSELLAAALAADPTDAGAAAAFTDAVVEDAGAGAGFLGYHPEMGEARPVAHMEARLSHYGKHYFVDTPLTLKGRGIEHLGAYTAARLVGGEKNRRCGWNEYKVTLKAMEKLQATYRISSEMLLD